MWNQFNENDLLDCELLSKYIKDRINEINVTQQEKIIPFIPGSKTILGSLNKLNKSQYSFARKKASIHRFHAYVSSDFLNHAEEYMLAAINKYPDDKAVYPYQQQVQAYLNTSKEYVKSTQRLLEKFNDSSYKKDFVKYTQQVAKFDKFIRTKILPKARLTPAWPSAAYRQLLANYGIENINFDEMIKQGQRDFAKVYIQYQDLAEQIANNYNLQEKSPLAIVKFLKRNKIMSPDKVLKLYQDTSIELDKLIRKNELITLPDSPLKIRLSGPTESKMHPAPRIIVPPRVNPKGLVPIFVVPVSNSGLPYDDFTYPAVTTALLAHEGRPGHDLQFRNIHTAHVNLIRGYYAKHSAETEGWALYAEDMIFPYVGVEEKFGILQLRLQRIARYFLEPLIQLNKITKNEVIDILHNQVGLSKELAEVEYKRYTYLLPGQAPTYYYGLLKIQELKAQLTDQYGSLNEKCFNDTMLSFGMIPVKYVYRFADKFKQCQ